MRTRPALLKFFLTIALCTGIGLFSGCRRPAAPAADSARDTGPGAAALIAKYKTGTTNIVVEVDGVVLTKPEMDAHVARLMTAQRMGDIPPEMQAQALQEMSKQVIERFVTQTILLNEAKKKNIAVTDAECQAALADLKKGLPEGISMDEALKSFGMSEAQLKKDMTSDLQIRKMLDAQVGAIATPSDADVDKFYKESQQFFAVPESVTARHVLVKCEPEASEAVQKEKKEKAEAVRARLVKGDDFAAVAKESSDCPSREDGGQLGTLVRGRAVKSFEDAAFSQKINEIGPVVKTEFGYHVIQVSKKEEARTRPLAEVKGEISDYLSKEKKDEAIEKYVLGLRRGAQVKYGESWSEAGSSKMGAPVPVME